MSSSSNKNDIEDPDNAVTFFNFSKDRVARYSGKILDPPSSVPIQIMDTIEGTIKTTIVEATEKKYNSPLRGGCQGESSRAYNEALTISRTFVMSDSFFSKNSALYDSSGFLEHGLEPLKEFYRNGGRVVVVCEEGISNIEDGLRSTFGCEWRLGKIETEICVPTTKGIELLGADTNEINAVKGHMMIAPEDEMLYNIKILPEQQYYIDYFDFEPSEKYSKEEVDYAKESYASYKEENSTNSLIALHTNDSGGSLVWIGDRNEDDSKMRAVFARLCCS